MNAREKFLRFWVVCGLFTLFAGALLILPVTLQADPGVLYAAPTAGGSGDCSSWANACTLQTALLNASDGDQIWVQMGLHKPTTTADRTIAFELPTGVAVYGGFAGTETQLEQRDWQENLTVLSGDIDNNDLTDPAGVVTNTANIIGANSYHVVYSSLNETGRLDGFIITAGQANGAIILEQNKGGGLYSDIGSSLTVVNVIISGNMADDGGGMYCEGSDHLTSNPTLINVDFIGNTAVQYGGGLNSLSNNLSLINVNFTRNSAGWSGGGMLNGSLDAVLTNLTFYHNTATDYGGGMANYSSNLALTDAIFNNNTAFTGGGMYNQDLSDASNLTLTAITFHANLATLGGGMFNDGSDPMLVDMGFSENLAHYGSGMFNKDSSPTLIGVNFTDNQALWDGGGMYNDNSSPTLTAVAFRNNSLSNGFGGGLTNINGSNPLLVNVLFDGNTANTFGGGIHNDLNSNPTLINVTLSNNTAFFDGGGIYNDNSNPTLHNSILWGNSAGRDGDQLYNTWNSAPTIAYSNIQGSGGSGTGWDGTLGVDGGGNIDADPRFTDLAAGNVRLEPDSPAIDAGNNAAVPPDVSTDLDGNPRFVDIPFIPNSGSGTPPIVDMGAYEASFADVSLSKTIFPPFIAPGEKITFTLHLTGSGSLTATQAILTDTLPAFLTVQNILVNGVTITDTGTSPAYVWQVADLAPGQSGVITITGVLTLPLTAGVYTNTAVLTADNDAWPLNNSASVTYTVANVAPIFSSTAVLTATQDSPYTYAITATDANGDALTITAPVLPDWLTLVDTGDGTAVLSGAPSLTDVGDHLVELRVSDSGGLSESQIFTVRVLGAPGFTLYLPFIGQNSP